VTFDPSSRREMAQTHTFNRRARSNRALRQSDGYRNCTQWSGRKGDESFPRLAGEKFRQRRRRNAVRLTVRSNKTLPYSAILKII